MRLLQVLTKLILFISIINDLLIMDEKSKITHTFIFEISYQTQFIL